MEMLLPFAFLTTLPLASRTSMTPSLATEMTLLLLSKIENNQFPERADIDIVEIINNEIGIYSEIYGDSIKCKTELPERFVVNMNESLATTMITNLIKNAFLHANEDGIVEISIIKSELIVANNGDGPLDGSRLFDRFYTSGKKGSTGLGLALVKSIADSYNFKIGYSYKEEKHRFAVKF